MITNFTTLTLLPAAVFSLFTIVNDFQKELPHPVSIKEDYNLTTTRLALKELGAPKQHLEKLTNGVYAASVATKIDPILIASIIPKESEFKISAKSPVGYKGLMQSNKATMQWGFAEADILYGALILKEKIQIAKGDVDRGMVFYKGHGGAASQKFASDQMKFYRSIKEKVLAKMKEEEKNGRS